MFETMVESSHVIVNEVMSPGAETIKPDGESGVLGASNDLRQEICNHLLGNTVTHDDLTYRNIATDKIIPNS